MEFLSRALDDPAAAPCGKCMNCAEQKTRRLAPEALVQEAVNFLRTDSLVLESRNRWPRPLLDDLEKTRPELLERYESGRPKTTIPEKFRPEPGRVLCIYGDAGWGDAVARGKYQTGRFDQSLVRAAADLIQNKWKPDPAPKWVAAVPSQRHFELVHDFAERLAAELNIPFAPVLRRKNQARPQKEMQNSVMQLRNILNSFQAAASADLPIFASAAQAIQPHGSVAAKTTHSWAGRLTEFAQHVIGTAASAPALPALPVLLIDDVVDSGWTLTLAGICLRQQGSGPVYPFALAKASPRGA